MQHKAPAKITVGMAHLNVDLLLCQVHGCLQPRAVVVVDSIQHLQAVATQQFSNWIKKILCDWDILRGPTVQELGVPSTLQLQQWDARTDTLQPCIRDTAIPTVGIFTGTAYLSTTSAGPVLPNSCNLVFNSLGDLQLPVSTSSSLHAERSELKIVICGLRDFTGRELVSRKLIHSHQLHADHSVHSRSTSVIRVGDICMLSIF